MNKLLNDKRMTKLTNIYNEQNIYHKVSCLSQMIASLEPYWIMNIVERLNH